MRNVLVRVAQIFLIIYASSTKTFVCKVENSSFLFKTYLAIVIRIEAF